jgi:hypothetical protein
MTALQGAIGWNSARPAAHNRQKIRHITYRGMSIKPQIDHQMG